jgi:hypothetical protein
MYFKLYSHLSSRGFQPIQQNVSIGLNYKEIHIDITPGIQQGSNRNDHSIYRSSKIPLTKMTVSEPWYCSTGFLC